jgi:hypothetical protein
VYLKSGISGTIPRNRIRVLPDEPLARLTDGYPLRIHIFYD